MVAPRNAKSTCAEHGANPAAAGNSGRAFMCLLVPLRAMPHSCGRGRMLIRGDFTAFGLVLRALAAPCKELGEASDVNLFPNAKCRCVIPWQQSKRLCQEAVFLSLNISPSA